MNGVAYLRWENPKVPSAPVLKLLVPGGLRKDIFRQCHNAIFSGHFGVKKTIARVQHRFHWYGLTADVKLHIRNCVTCSENKMLLRKFRASMADFRVGVPLDCVGIDLMGPLPMTKQGSKHLLVVVDYFMRWVEAFPLPDQTAETVARSFIHDFVCRFGAPLEVHSDQGRNFESCLFKEACRLLEITKTRTTPYHPSSNGLVERYNRTLGTLIRTYLDQHHNDWDQYIPLLTSAYRSTVHPSTGFTPNYLMLGRETTMPVDLVFPRPVQDVGDVPEYVEKLQERLSACYALARESLKRAAERQKKLHDTRMVQAQHLAGQAVVKPSFGGNKLSKPWVGPYIVIRPLSDCTRSPTRKAPISSITICSSHMNLLNFLSGQRRYKPLCHSQPNLHELQEVRIKIGFVFSEWNFQTFQRPSATRGRPSSHVENVGFSKTSGPSRYTLWPITWRPVKSRTTACCAGPAT